MSLFKKRQPDVPRRRLNGDEVSKPSSSDVFRRNRTITGTTSVILDSTNAKSDLESSRTHVHRLATLRRKIFAIFAIILTSSVLLFILISNFTAVVKVSLSDTSISKKIDTSYYEKAIQSYFDTNPVSRLRFLLDQSSLTAYISNKFPEVDSVGQQNTFGFGKTSFTVVMRTPVAGWVINSKQYYVDSKGVAFEKNYFATPTVQIVDESGASIQSASSAAIVSNRFLSFVGRVVSLAKTNGYTVTEAILPAGTTRELEIKIKENDFLIKLSIDRPVGEQVEDMCRAVSYFISAGRTPSYIDVRVSGKAFFM